jgi:hypothetical protein
MGLEIVSNGCQTYRFCKSDQSTYLGNPKFIVYGSGFSAETVLLKMRALRVIPSWIAEAI